MDGSVVIARDASYTKGRYRSFQFVSLEVGPGTAHAVLASEHAAARDLLLAIAGLVQPTGGELIVGAGNDVPPRRRFPFHAGAPCAGIGVIGGVADVEDELTVLEAVSREVRLRTRAGEGEDVLSYLAQLGLATAADQRISALAAPLRARLSAALALAGSPEVAVVDLADGFAAGLAVDDALALARDIAAFCRKSGSACVVALSDPASAAAFDAVCPIDIQAEEALAAFASEGVAQ